MPGGMTRMGVRTGTLALAGDKTKPMMSENSPTTNDLWTRALGRLRARSSRASADPWLERIAFVHADTGRVQLAVADAAHREFVSSHYLDEIQASLQALAGGPLLVELIVAGDLRDGLPFAVQPDAAPDVLRPGWQPALRGIEFLPARDATAHATDDEAQLSARFTFSQFVVGQANELAASAAHAVADAPGTVFNPLFIYGGVGIGKTHLLHAIGHAVRERRRVSGQHEGHQRESGQPELRVRYVATETFIDDAFTAWRSKDPRARADLRDYYRSNVDVLLLDDVQFLQGRERVQEEFFHAFNALHHAGKQIVLTCDRFPSELQQFHERLRSRFEWGLVAELMPPDRELRVAILVHKAAAQGLNLPPDVIYYLADHLRNNVRELEGALHKLGAHSRIGNRAIDLAFARAVLGPIIELPSRNVTVEVIQRVTAQHFGLKVTDLKGGKRHKAVVLPRMIAVYLTRKHTGLSYPDIGRAFGGRDHTTALHAWQRIGFRVQSDEAVQRAVAAIETALGK
jgi:chromosomal replication initiator protein